MERLTPARLHAGPEPPPPPPPPPRPPPNPAPAPPPPPILVLGATGRPGRRVADRLAALGRDVRRGSRGGAPPFDWEDPPTWGPALEGARQAYISFFPDLAVPGAAETVGALGEQA